MAWWLRAWVMVAGIPTRRVGGQCGDRRAAMHVLAHSGHSWTAQDFFPYGYDERQYCSPGFDLPVGCLMRSPMAASRVPHFRRQSRFCASRIPVGIACLLSGCSRGARTQPILYESESKCEPQLGKRVSMRHWRDSDVAKNSSRCSGY